MPFARGSVPPGQASLLAARVAEPAPDRSIPVLKVGGPIQKTGKHAEVGLAAIAAMELWAQWVREHYVNPWWVGGEGLGYYVELHFEDDESDPAKATDIVKRMLPDLDVVVAPYTSTASLAVVKAVDSSKMTLVWGGASADIFESGKSNVFGTFTQASSYMDSGLEALQRVGAKSVVLAANDKMFPREVCSGAKKKAKSLGMTVAREIQLNADGSNAEAEVAAMAAGMGNSDFDVVVGCGHMKDVSALVSAVRKKTVPKAVLATQVATPEFRQEAGAAADCLLMPTQWVPAATAGARDSLTGWDAREFVARFQRKTGSSPAYQSASAFAAVLALSHAVKDAGSLADLARISKSMAQLDIDTFYGRIRFAASGALVGKPMYTVQNQPKGEPKVVAPDGEVSIVYPLSQCGTSTKPIHSGSTAQRRLAGVAALLTMTCSCFLPRL